MIRQGVSEREREQGTSQEAKRQGNRVAGLSAATSSGGGETDAPCLGA